MTVRPISEAVGAAACPAPAATELPSTAELVGELRRLFDRLDEAHDEAVRMAQEFADAEYEYEIAHASSRLAVEAQGGSVGAKDAAAKQSSASKKRAMTLAQELRRSARDAEENVRQQMSALQTVAAAVRAEIELAGRGPRST